jgi:hypothetical protein
MLIARGLLTFIAGLAFVFLPGAVIAATLRRDMRLGSNLLLWGIGLILLVFPAQFLSTLIRLIAIGDQPLQGMLVFVFAFLTSVLVAVFIEGGKYLLLRFRKVPQEGLMDGGAMVGLGVGLMFNVFWGIGLVGTGASLIIGDTSTPDLARIAGQEWPSLIANLVALIIYRVGLVAVSTALGVVAARALLSGRLAWLGLAVAISGVTSFIYASIGLALGNDSLIASLAAIVYCGLMAGLALRWLFIQPVASPPAQQKNAKRRSAATADTR